MRIRHKRAHFSVFRPVALRIRRMGEGRAYRTTVFELASLLSTVGVSPSNSACRFISDVIQWFGRPLSADKKDSAVLSVEGSCCCFLVACLGQDCSLVRALRCAGLSCSGLYEVRPAVYGIAPFGCNEYFFNDDKNKISSLIKSSPK